MFSCLTGASSADGKVGCGRLSAQVEEWFQTGRMRLMEACEERNPSIVGDAKKAEEARQRLASLSVGQDTKGVSFAGDALHHLYFSTKFERRGVLLYWILRMACAKSAQIKESLCKPSGDRLMVSSVGGGPGWSSSKGEVRLCPRSVRYATLDRNIVSMCMQEGLHAAPSPSHPLQRIPTKDSIHTCCRATRGPFSTLSIFSRHR